MSLTPVHSPPHPTSQAHTGVLLEGHFLCWWNIGAGIEGVIWELAVLHLKALLWMALVMGSMITRLYLFLYIPGITPNQHTHTQVYTYISYTHIHTHTFCTFIQISQMYILNKHIHIHTCVYYTYHIMSTTTILQFDQTMQSKTDNVPWKNSPHPRKQRRKLATSPTQLSVYFSSSTPSHCLRRYIYLNFWTKKPPALKSKISAPPFPPPMF